MLTKLRSFLPRTSLAVRCLSVKRNINQNAEFQEEFTELNRSYTNIVQEICNRDIIKKTPGLSKRYESLLNYWNYENIKSIPIHADSILNLYIYKRLEQPDRLTSENLQKACIASIALKMFESAYLIADDIIDHSKTRYGKPSWHKKVNVEEAVLDIHFLENAAYLLLLKYLKDHPQFLNLMNFYHEEIFRVTIGELIDITKVTVEKAADLFQQKLIKGYYKILVPIRNAMYLANIDNPEYHEKVIAILEPVGEIIAIQNDYYDLYAPFSVSKKHGNDITEQKNTWFLVKAWELGNNTQKEILQTCYGKDNEECEKKIVQVYEDLKLENLCKEYIKNYFVNIYRKIDNELPKQLPRNLFHHYVQLIEKDFFTV